ncbi:MAG TPA: hypothetical protein VEY92_13555, partial [Pseudoxanthomonas sp.]|nr:hypothetical protein [Pseudoxanthomonas sp.]
QRRFLAEQGCAVLQGYLLSPPLSARALEQWLPRGRTAAIDGTGSAVTAPAEALECTVSR